MSSTPLLQRGVGAGPSVFAGVVWLNQIDVTDAQCLREFQKRHDRWIPLATLQATKVLLAEPERSWTCSWVRPLR